MKKILQCLSIVMFGSCVVSSSEAALGNNVNQEISNVRENAILWRQNFESEKKGWGRADDSQDSTGDTALGQYLADIFQRYKADDLETIAQEIKALSTSKDLERNANDVFKALTNQWNIPVFKTTPFGESLSGMIHMLGCYKKAMDTGELLQINNWHDLRRLDRAVRLMSRTSGFTANTRRFFPVNIVVDWVKTRFTTVEPYIYSWEKLGHKVDGDRLGRFCSTLPINKLRIDISDNYWYGQNTGFPQSFSGIWGTVRNNSNTPQGYFNSVRVLEVVRQKLGTVKDTCNGSEDCGWEDINLATKLREVTLDKIALDKTGAERLIALDETEKKRLSELGYLASECRIPPAERIERMELSCVRFENEFCIDGKWNKLQKLKITEPVGQEADYNGWKKVDLKKLGEVTTLTDLELSGKKLTSADMMGVLEWARSNTRCNEARLTFDNVTFDEMDVFSAADAKRKADDKGKALEVTYNINTQSRPANQNNLIKAQEALKRLNVKKLTLSVAEVDLSSQRVLFELVRSVVCDNDQLQELRLDLNREFNGNEFLDGMTKSEKWETCRQKIESGEVKFYVKVQQ